MCNSLEYFLDIYESEDYDASEYREEDDEEGEHENTNKKAKGGEAKKVIH